MPKKRKFTWGKASSECDSKWEVKNIVSEAQNWKSKVIDGYRYIYLVQYSAL